MEVEDLLTIIREDYLDDVVKPYRWDQAKLYRWLDMAQKEACRRQPLLVDDTTPAVCDLVTSPLTASYSLHPRAHLAMEMRMDGNILPKSTPELLDRAIPYWKTAEADIPVAWIQNDMTVTLVPPPAIATTIKLKVWRLPLIDVSDIDASLEIDSAYHEDLAHYVAARAYMLPDEDLRDTNMHAYHQAEFDAVFGPALRADVVAHRRRESGVAHITGPRYHGRNAPGIRKPFDFC